MADVAIDTDNGENARSDAVPGLVSVVIPTYNRAHCVRRAIDSVVAQTHPHVEIVVVDDASIDHTADVVRDLECPLSLRLIELPRNRGAAIARNTGVDAARGALVAFLDSDDAWHPRKLERQLELLSRRGPPYGACYTGIATYDERGRLRGLSRAVEEGDIRLGLLNHNLVGSTSCVVARRDLLRAAGGFTPGLRSCQDWELWVRLAALTKFACVPDVLTMVHAAAQGRITTSGGGRLSGHLYMYRTHLRRYFRSGAVDPGMFRALLGEIFMQMGRQDYAARLFHANWLAKPLSAKRLTLYLMAACRVGGPSFFRAAELIARVEDRLRPSPIAPPETAMRPSVERVA